MILEGEGYLELDGERVPVRPLTAVFIRPGCRHRAVGKLRILNIPVPAFDPADEFEDDENAQSPPEIWVEGVNQLNAFHAVARAGRDG